jgi:CHAT domain-containing protein/Flp pilus assembly protein TadD
MRLLVLAALGLAACGSNVRRLDEEFRDATALRRAERFDLALPKTDAGLGRAEKSGDLRAVWRFRLLKVDILLGYREVAQAASLLKVYGDPPSGPEWSEARGRDLLFRGQAAYTLSRLAEADRLLQRAADAAREADSPTLIAEVELRRGTLLVMQTHFDEARAALQQTIEHSRKIPDRYIEAIATNNIGYALFTESRYDEAIPWFERAKALSIQLGAGDSVARADGSLGNCYARLGDDENARLHYDRAQAAFALTGNRFGQQTYMGNAGNLLLAAEDYTGAIASYTRALAIARALHDPVWAARWLSNLASASIELGDWDAAEKYYNEARALKKDLGDKLYEPNSLINAARIAAGRNQFDESARLFREAMKGEAEDPSVSLEAHAGLASLFIRAGQPDKAEAEFRTATDAIDQRGASLLKDDYKLSFLASLIRFNRQYVDFLMARNEPERALEVAELSRTRVLARRSGSTQPVERWTSRDYERLARRTHAALLEFWLGKDRSYLWVVTHDRVRAHELPSKSALHPLIESYRAVIIGGRNPLEVAGMTGGKLYDALLAPAVSDVPSESRFIIVPDEDLYSFNFESLPAGKDAGKFWIEQATVAIAPSLNFLAGGAEAVRSHPEAKMLLIGDPVSAMPQYPRLEFATQEMDSIASAMPRLESTVFKGADARPDSYDHASPGRFRFIHFSAHAAANQVSPLDSAVILSGPPDRSRLLARDVMNMPLTAELVTVSACRSAGGKTYAGEGLVGFAWSFLKAGAGNVIAGLWDVNDRSTSYLMTQLYREIAGGSPIADALRTSKLALIRKGGAWAKPFYWAPFQLYIGRVR